jgi:hypothetical protein
MKNAFISLLRSLGKLAHAPVDLQDPIEQGHALRETINNNFDKVRAFSDAVLFEFGPTRQQDLVLRSRIIGWQPQLRILFITRVALLKYRLRFPGFELPQGVDLAQQEFDDHLAVTLDGIADRFKGKARTRTEGLQDSFARLEETIRASEPAVSQGVISPHLQTFLHLSRRIDSLTISLDREICEVEGAPQQNRLNLWTANSPQTDAPPRGQVTLSCLAVGISSSPVNVRYRYCLKSIASPQTDVDSEVGKRIRKTAPLEGGLPPQPCLLELPRSLSRWPGPGRCRRSGRKVLDRICQR